MPFSCQDFDQVGVIASEVVVCRSDGSWEGEFMLITDVPMILAHRLTSRVFILTADGESESVRLRHALPATNFIYPTLHRPNDFAELLGHQPNALERNVRRRMPIRMSIDNQSTDEFKNALAPYCDGRQFRMDEDLYMLMKMRF